MAFEFVKPANNELILNRNQASGGENIDFIPANVRGSMKLVIAIPCFNEEIAISGIVLRAKKYSENVVVIDDGSTDKTAELANICGAHVIHHEINQGKGAGIRQAFNYAKMHNADLLVLIDGDGQHNPEDIPWLIAPIIKGEADMVNGSRFLIKNKNRVPMLRRIGQKILTVITNIGSKMKLTDSQSGFRAFSKKAFDSFSFNEKGMGIESEMILDAAKANVMIREVPVDIRYDVDGSTYNPFVHGFSVLNSTIRILSKRRPVLSFELPGIILLIMGMVSLSYMTHLFNLTKNIEISYIILGVIFSLIGIVLTLAGLIVWLNVDART